MTDDNRPGLACAKPHHPAPIKAAARALMLLAFVLALLAPVLAQAQINWTGVPAWLSKNQSLPTAPINVLAVSLISGQNTGVSWGFRHNCFGNTYANNPRRIMYSYLDNHNDKFVQTGGNSGGDNSRVELQDPANQHVRLQFRSTLRFVGVWTITLRFVSNGCATGNNADNQADAVFTITTTATRSNGSAHRTNAYRPFRTDILLSNTSPVTTGIRLQRGAIGCRNTDMRLLNHTDYLRLQYLNPSSNAVTGALAVNHDNVPMLHETTSSRRALAVLFKAGATVRPGTLQVEVQESSNSCGSGFPSTLTVQLTVADALPWVAGPSSRAQATAVFMASAGGTPQTGIQFASHIGIASARVCDQAAVEISDLEVAGTTIKARQVTQLAFFRGTNWERRTGSRVTIGWTWSNGHAKLELRNNNTPRPPAGTLTITVVASPHSCSKPGVPDPLTVAYKITVAEEWENLTRNQTAAAGGFVAPALSQSQAPTDTGIRLHRSSKGCRYIDVQLNAPSYLGLMEMRMNGTMSITVNPGSAPVQQHQQLRMDTGAGANDRHLRLMFAAQANVGARTRTEAVTVIGTPAARCSVGTRPTVAFTISYMVTINARHTAEVFTKDNINSTGATLVVENVLNATEPLETGVFVHRSSQGCRRMNVSVGDANYLLQRFDSSGNPTGTAAQQLSGVEMRGDGSAGDYYVQLLARHGQPGRGQSADNIPVMIAAACGPDSGAPVAETKRVQVAYVNSWVTVAGGFDRLQPSRSFPRAQLLTSSFTETGIAFHRRIVANLNCGETIDLDLVNGSDAWFQLRKHEDDGTVDGAPASSFDNVNVVSGANRRHFRLLFKERVKLEGGSIVKATVVSETRGGCNPKPANLTMVYEVAIDYGQGEMPVVGDATGAAAARVIGLRGMDTVLQRSAVADAPGGLSLLELLANKEAELESGEIDLRSFLAGQSFALGLDASAAGRSRFGVWGRAETLALEGDGDDTALRHEGDMFAAQVGVDFRVASDALFGLGYGRYELDTEYSGRRNNGGYEGTYVLALDLVQPYAAMPFLGGDLAAAASIGSGSAQFVGKAGDESYTDKHDAQYRGWGLGYRSEVPVSGTDLGVEGSVSGALLEVPTLGSGVEADNMSLRLGLEFARSMDFAAGTVRPAAGAAYARDWGDDPGSKHEFSAGVGYEAGQLSAQVEFLHVGMDAGDAKANGAALAVRYAPAAGALGLGLAVAPQHGASAAEGKSMEDLLAGADAGLRGTAEMSYGLAVDGGVLTPYGGWSFDGGASELGLRLRTGAASKWLLRWQGTAEDELKIEYRLGD